MCQCGTITSTGHAFTRCLLLCHWIRNAWSHGPLTALLPADQIDSEVSCARSSMLTMQHALDVPCVAPAHFEAPNSNVSFAPSKQLIPQDVIKACASVMCIVTPPTSISRTLLRSFINTPLLLRLGLFHVSVYLRSYVCEQLVGCPLLFPLLHCLKWAQARSEQ